MKLRGLAGKENDGQRSCNVVQLEGASSWQSSRQQTLVVAHPLTMHPTESVRTNALAEVGNNVFEDKL